MGGASAKISTREIDEILSGLSSSEQEGLVVEVRRDKSNDTLIIHTPNGALCYDAGATQAIGQPVWYKMNSGANTDDEYRGKFLVWCYNRWLVSDTQSGRVGHLDRATQSHWGDVVSWEFGTPVIYNGARGVLSTHLRLLGLLGQGILATRPRLAQNIALMARCGHSLNISMQGRRATGAAGSNGQSRAHSGSGACIAFAVTARGLLLRRP